MPIERLKLWVIISDAITPLIFLIVSVALLILMIAKSRCSNSIRVFIRLIEPTDAVGRVVELKLLRQGKRLIFPCCMAIGSALSPTRKFSEGCVFFVHPLQLNELFLRNKVLNSSI
jgi:hypothetical protein